MLCVSQSFEHGLHYMASALSLPRTVSYTAEDYPPLPYTLILKHAPEPSRLFSYCSMADTPHTPSRAGVPESPWLPTPYETNDPLTPTQLAAPASGGYGRTYVLPPFGDPGPEAGGVNPHHTVIRRELHFSDPGSSNHSPAACFVSPVPVSLLSRYSSGGVVAGMYSLSTPRTQSLTQLDSSDSSSSTLSSSAEPWHLPSSAERSDSAARSDAATVMTSSSSSRRYPASPPLPHFMLPAVDPELSRVVMDLQAAVMILRSRRDWESEAHLKRLHQLLGLINKISFGRQTDPTEQSAWVLWVLACAPADPRFWFILRRQRHQHTPHFVHVQGGACLVGRADAGGPRVSEVQRVVRVSLM